MTGVSEDMAMRTEELVREAVAVSIEAERQADELDRSLAMLRALWGADAW